MRIVVAKTGAVYGARLLAALRDLEAETHLVLSRWAIIAPPVPAFCSNPKSIDDLVDMRLAAYRTCLGWNCQGSSAGAACPHPTRSADHF